MTDKPVNGDVLSGLPSLSNEGWRSIGLTVVTILVPLFFLTLCIVAFRLFRKWKLSQNRYLKIKPNAEQDLRWYSPSKLKSFMNSSQFGMNWLVGQVFLSFLAFFIEILELYLNREKAGLVLIETIITFLFSIDYILFFYCSKDRLKYIYSPFALLDLVTVVPTFVGQFSPSISMNSIALRSLRLLRVLRIVRVSRAIKFLRSRVEQEIFTLCSILVSLLLICASVITAIEGFKFHDSLYFTVVTFTTVGYGDIRPITEAGRMAMMIIIIVGLILLSYKSSKLISLIQSTSPYSGNYVRRKKFEKHVLLLGTFSAHSLREFLSQIFARENYSLLKVVILNSKKPSFEVKQLLSSFQYQSNVLYLVGSEMVESDLIRVLARSASACYILGDRNGLTEDHQLDNNTILRCLAVKSFAPKISIFVQLATPQNQARTLQMPMDRMIVHDELILRLLGESSANPGLSTLLINLFRVYSRHRGDLYGWQKEYYHGCSQEIFTVRLPNTFVGATFQQVAKVLYCEFFAVLIGLEVTHENGETYLEPIPFDSTVKKSSRATIITANKQISKQIEDYDGDSASSLLNILKTHHAQKMREMNEPSLKNRATLIARNFFTTDEAPLLFNDISLIDPSVATSILVENSDNFSEFVGEKVEISTQNPKMEDDHEIVALESSNSLFDIEDIMDSPASPKEQRNLQEKSQRLEKNEKRSGTLEESTLNRVELSGHIIVIGSFDRFVQVLGPLRSNKLHHFIPVVLMNDQKPSNQEWNTHISHLPSVYFIQGTPLRDLERAGVNNALRIILLRQFTRIKAEDDAQFLDSGSVITMRSIESQFKFNSLISELALESSIKFLLRSSVLDEEDIEITHAQNEAFQKWYQWTYYYEYQPTCGFNIEFAAGRVLTNSMMYSLLPQAFKNPLGFSFLQGVILGRRPAKPLEEYPCSAFQIPVPSEFKGRVYKELFEYLLEKKIVALGLYRSSETHLSRHPYVFTNPVPNIQVSKSDRVFVLSLNQPNLQ